MAESLSHYRRLNVRVEAGSYFPNWRNIAIALKIPLCGSKREMAWSIKGEVKKILLLRPEGGKYSAISSPTHHEDAYQVLCPWIGFALFDLSSFHLLLVATTPIGF